MNPRERMLALILVGAIVGIGGIFIAYQFFWRPIRTRDSLRDDLEKRIAAKQVQVAELEAKKSQMERWRSLSLPSNAHLAWGEYQKYLNETITASGFTPGAMKVTSREPEPLAVSKSRKQPFIKLNYELNGHGNLSSLVKLLERFYKTPLLHQIKSIDILKPETVRADQKPDELDIKLKIEALILEGAANRTELMVKENPPEVRSLADKPRSYSDIVARNIFQRPAPAVEVTPREVPDNLRYVHLTDITHNEAKTEGWLYDRYNNVNSRLREGVGFNQYVMMADEDGNPIIRLSVVHMDDANRDLVFRVELADKENDASRKRERNRIYRANCKELCQLTDSNKVTTADEDRVYWVDAEFWGALRTQGVVRLEGSDFRFRYDLVRGKVIQSEGGSVFLLLNKQYCSYPGAQGFRKPKPHEGYCTFHVGANLNEALQNTLDPKKVEALKAMMPPSPSP